MKGISTVIATILMLMITIALAGTAYLYISGAFTQQTQGLELVDAYCNNRVNAVISVRNVGTTDISYDVDNCLAASGAVANGVSVSCGSVRITRTSGQGGSSFWPSGNVATVAPGTAATLTDGDDPATGAVAEGCTVLGTPRSCVYRIIPPSGRSVVATVSCTG
ncbi:MAG: hypothetical protein HYS80_00180 [Candidatus Aenigmarchaeota archaeon]|nr:hypothetical protein [Candidatus Aenigmarchaeota archaeon]